MRLVGRGLPAATGHRLPGAGGAVLSLAFGADGHSLHAAGARVPAQTYDIDPARAVTEVCRRAGGTLSPSAWRTYLPAIDLAEPLFVSGGVGWPRWIRRILRR